MAVFSFIAALPPIVIAILVILILGLIFSIFKKFVKAALYIGALIVLFLVISKLLNL